MLKRCCAFLVFSVLFGSVGGVMAQDLPDLPDLPVAPTAAIPSLPDTVLNGVAASVPDADDFSQMTPPEISRRLRDISDEVRVLNAEIKKLQKTLSEPHTVVGSQEEAEFFEAIYKRSEQDYLGDIALWEERIQHADEDPWNKTLKKGWIEHLQRCYQGLGYVRGEIAYWSAQKAARQTVSPELSKELNQKKAALAALQSEEKKLTELQKPKNSGWTPVAETEEKSDDTTVKTSASAGDATGDSDDAGGNDTEPVSAGEISSDDFFDGDGASELSAETADIKRNMTFQELLEEDQADAFAELGVTDAALTVVETANLVGKGTQTVIGIVPGLGSVDIALSVGRGFAESLGEELAKGTSMADALKIAAVNGGINGTISYVGNKLTGGADRLANRVVILSEVGFSKLTTKQVSEMGAKGISFLVVKGTQTGTQEVVGAAIKPSVDKLTDTLRSKPGQNSGTSTSGGYGGYGTSTATQPLVHY